MIDCAFAIELRARINPDSFKFLCHGILPPEKETKRGRKAAKTEDVTMVQKDCWPYLQDQLMGLKGVQHRSPTETVISLASWVGCGEESPTSSELWLIIILVWNLVFKNGALLGS